MILKGEQKKTFTFFKWLLRSQFLQYRYVTPTIRTEILSEFQIMLQIYCDVHTFCATSENVPQGSIFKLPGRNNNILDKEIKRPLHRLQRSGRWIKSGMVYLSNCVEQAICY